jgi:formylglycine-generating enzyme required for sulfatase activity
VTRGEFSDFVKETRYATKPGCVLFANHRYPNDRNANWQNLDFEQTKRDPVVCVSWEDAQAYVAWLNSKVGKNLYRLPSEAEWEYAARSGTRTARWWGEEIGVNNAVCDGCGSQWDTKRTAPVGSFPPNQFGLFDMAGNVWEWVQDCWNESYVGAPTDGRPWLTGKCEWRTWRGGSWNSVPWVVRSATRSKFGLSERGNDVGFRVAKTIE